jgi:hypothetical protein
MIDAVCKHGWSSLHPQPCPECQEEATPPDWDAAHNARVRAILLKGIRDKAEAILGDAAALIDADVLTPAPAASPRRTRSS